MKRLELWLCALDDLGARCAVSTRLDGKAVEKRVSHEGEEFFTLTLPAFCKDFESALREGVITSERWIGWKKQEITYPWESDSLPSSARALISGPPYFLSGFLNLVFDSESGFVRHVDPLNLDEVERIADAVQAVRQLTLMFGKELTECSEDRRMAAYEQYVETDRNLTSVLQVFLERKDAWAELDDLKRTFRFLFADVCSSLDKQVYEHDLLPKHGPGVTADKKLGNQKFYQSVWTERMEGVFPYGEYCLPNWRYHGEIGAVKFLSPGAELPVRVTDVPKTARDPRIIAIEPTCRQYMQQALAIPLVQGLGDVSSPTSWLLGFRDQWPNQAMAQIGSEDGSLATLDLSEASDRVPNWLVELLFEDFPWLAEGIQACRGQQATLPDGQVIDLQKFASMGSALTFPIEAMVFITVILTGLSKSMGEPVSRAFVKTLRDKVRVYGDDIVVPADNAVDVIEHLELFGFKVNRSKSFWTGQFRESCGAEFYAGADVSIVRVRRALPQSRRDVEEIRSAISTRNQFYEAGMWKTANAYDVVLDEVLQGLYPYIRPTSPVLGRVSAIFPWGETTNRWSYPGQDRLHRDYQSPIVKGWLNADRLPSNAVDDWPALLKCLLLEAVSDVYPDPWVHDPGDLAELYGSSKGEHLLRSGRPRAPRIRRAVGPPE